MPLGCLALQRDGHQQVQPWGHRRPAGQMLRRAEGDAQSAILAMQSAIPGTQSTVPRPGMQSAIRALRALYPVPGMQSAVWGPIGPCASQLRARCLHGSERGHGGWRQCPEARGHVHCPGDPLGGFPSARTGPGCPEGNEGGSGGAGEVPPVGLLGVKLSPLLGHATSHMLPSLSEKCSASRRIQAETELPPGPLQTAAGRPHPCPGHPVLLPWLGFTLWLPACPPMNPPRGAYPHDPSAPFLRPWPGD